MYYEDFLLQKEYGAAGAFEEESRGLFYRKALGIRKFYEHCELAEYHGERLYPSGVLPNKMHIFPHYLNGLQIEYEAVAKTDRKAADAFIETFCQYHSSVPKEHTVAGNMYTHSMPNYERILKEGLSSYKNRIGAIKDNDIKEGLLHVICGIEQYLSRCIAYLQSVHASPELIAALEKVPMHPAETIYEAVVAWNFILYLDNCDNLGCVASGLLPYYRGENIVDLLKNLYDNLDQNNGYSMALGTDYSPLTLQCLEAAKGKRRPMIELFVNADTPDAVWDMAFENIRSMNGQPAFYNENVLIKGLKERIPTIKEADLKRFCGGGCTESMFAGLSNVGSLDAGINLLLILEKTILSKLTCVKSFDEFYNAYLQNVKTTLKSVTDEISNSQKARAKYNPLPMRTLLIDDCIDKGIDYNNGGARYCYSIINFAGLINVIDAMLVIADFVFNEKTYSKAEFLSRLKSNDPVLQDRAKQHPYSYGNDQPRVNAFANKLSTDIFSMLDEKKPLMGEAFLPASIQFMSQVDAGKEVGATPDGRSSGTPLCDSLGAIFQKDKNGPTALLNSVTSLNLERVLGVPVLNFNIMPDFQNEILKALILGYMDNGGIQMQITCMSRQVLEDAYQHPDQYKNLIVRVGGYSAYFCELSDELKRMVIDRTICSV